MNEVELGRYAGPFEEPPFDSYVQSPIGLVPKDKGLKTRLMFHLSYPKDGDSALKRVCDQQMESLLRVCEEIKFPVALEKTFWGSTVLIFLGMLLDTEKQVICIPMDKLVKASNWMEYFLNKKNKKATFLEFQKLCGTLNFLCKCIVPGRAFLRRLYVKAPKGGPALKQHHHIRITVENRLDLIVWRNFLRTPDSFYRPFIESVALNAAEIDMYSDASGNYLLGFGAYCGPEWIYGNWDTEFCERHRPSIEYLELFAVTVAVLNWIKLFQNRRIVLFCDNEVVVHMINNSSSSCKNCMVLVRLLTAEGICRNVRIFAKHLGTKNNGKADALSILDMERFRRLADNSINSHPFSIPAEIWPMTKIWKVQFTYHVKSYLQCLNILGIKRRKTRLPQDLNSVSSDSSKISTADMERIVDNLLARQCRDSTAKTCLSI